MFGKQFETDTKMTLEKHNERLHHLEEHRILCDQLHEKHLSQHRRFDDAINNQAESNIVLAKSVNELTSVLTEFTPTWKRAKDNYTTIDTVKQAAIWITTVAAAATIIYHWFF